MTDMTNILDTETPQSSPEDTVTPPTTFVIDMEDKVSPTMLAALWGQNISGLYQEFQQGRYGTKPLTEMTYREAMYTYRQSMIKSVDLKVAKEETERLARLKTIEEERLFQEEKLRIKTDAEIRKQAIEAEVEATRVKERALLADENAVTKAHATIREFESKLAGAFEEMERLAENLRESKATRLSEAKTYEARIATLEQKIRDGGDGVPLTAKDKARYRPGKNLDVSYGEDGEFVLDDAMHPLVKKQIMQKLRTDRANETKAWLSIAEQRKELLVKSELYKLYTPLLMLIKQTLVGLSLDFPVTRPRIEEALRYLADFGDTIMEEADEDSKKFIQHVLDTPVDEISSTLPFVPTFTVGTV